ncbi:hypothetical protein SAMN05444920_114213 [Nonomuraea solani]|uniref:Uncharacterized protein n=2 Tax=Nonomuraea solani TaxID=1144553 RepID=A0A1H6EQ16_9ACTN|nr:hypothetical protein SAMN05444920_114213 [Nonomuraea solani]
MDFTSAPGARPPHVCTIMMRRTSLADHIVMADSVPAVTAGLQAGGRVGPARARERIQVAG